MSDEHHDYRGYAGQVAGGTVRPGDEVIVLPVGARTRVESIDTADGELDEAFYPWSVTLRLEGDARRLARSLIASRRLCAPSPCASSRPRSAGWPRRR